MGINEDIINSYIIEEEPINETENSNIHIHRDIQSTIEKESKIGEHEKAFLINYINESIQNQKSRRIYARIFTSTMIIQLICINLFVLSQGKQWINLDVSIFNVFLIGVFTQLVAIVTIIFNNVFPKDHDKNKTDLQKALFGKGKSEE